MAYNVISADTHLDVTWMPGDVFVENAPAGLKDRMPRVEETDKGPMWMVEGEEMARVGGFIEYTPGHSRHMDRMAEVGFYDGVDEAIYHPAVPELRIKDQDIDGVDAEVIYGILGIGGGGFSGPGFRDPTVTTAVYDVYNEWVANFVKAGPDRMAALACLTSHDPETAAKQVRKSAEWGLRGAEMNVSKMVVPLYYEEWDVLWAASDETDMPISFHTLGLPSRMPDPDRAETYYHVSDGVREVLFQLSGAEFLTSAVYSGACDRFPNFKFVLGECGIGWIPYVIERMDDEYEDRYHPIGLSAKPTDFWRRQGYSTFQKEYVSMDQVQRIGENNIMWGSDYPHRDGVFPDSKKVLEEGLGHLDESVRRKIVCDNAARLYRFN